MAIRNRGCLPYLEKEGEQIKPIDTAGFSQAATGKEAFNRLHAHHTLASARRHAMFKPCPGLIPEDDLDFKLASTYEHGEEIFPDTVDTVMQPETQDIETWRRLQNTMDTGGSKVPTCKGRTAIIAKFGRIPKPKPPPKKHVKRARGGQWGANSGYAGYSPQVKDLKYTGLCMDILQIYKNPYNASHPVRIGGILERRHPSNIKLMCSSHHSPQTNMGYTRKDGDGTYFEY